MQALCAALFTDRQWFRMHPTKTRMAAVMAAIRMKTAALPTELCPHMVEAAGLEPATVGLLYLPLVYIYSN